MTAKKKAVRKGGKTKTLAEKITSALERFGAASTDRLARRLSAKGSSVSSACSRLFKAGVLKRTDATAQGRGGEAVWALAKKRAP